MIKHIDTKNLYRFLVENPKYGFKRQCIDLWKSSPSEIVNIIQQWFNIDCILERRQQNKCSPFNITVYAIGYNDFIICYQICDSCIPSYKSFFAKSPELELDVWRFTFLHESELDFDNLESYIDRNRYYW